MNQKDNKLGEFLRSARRQAGLTLRAAEETSGVSNAYLSQLENGKIRQPSPVTLHKLSELYKVSYADILGLTGYPVPARDSDGPTHARLASRLGPVTEEEEESLIEYLEFLRSRRRKQR